MRHVGRLASFAVLALCTAFAGAAQAETKVRFSLDWIPGSVHAPFFIAYYKGYYKAEGLDVAIDRGKGSVGLVQQLAAGVYDMGYPDISVLTEFNAKNPDKAFPEVMMGYEQAPAAVVVLKESGITTPKQLEGHVLGAAANDATFKLFPTFAQHAKFDMEKVKVQYIDPKLRETLLAKRQVDAIIGQVFNTKLELKAKGVDPGQVVPFLYRDYGLDLYGNGLAASATFLKEHPDAVKGFVRATLKGVRDMVANPEEAVQMTLKFEPLLNADIERDRLKLAMECCIITPNVLKHGFGAVDKARLDRGIGILAASYKLPRTPKADEVFDSAYLPPEKDRMVK
ncbi:MAG TPA: ABC transporter substrate-binding protein [Xanthobacteraceae bacterium]|jgi:NitT/TauT family transport system substrate-binding protein|nr:ABC transporter substrate-binding protein [Xanthobacteraceae bacterium]